MKTKWWETEYLEMIREHPELRWLIRQPDLERGWDRLEEYDRIKEQVAVFERTANWMCWLLLLALTTIAIISLDLVWQYGKLPIIAMIMVLLVFVVWTISFFTTHFLRGWNDFIELWVKVNWKNRHFQSEVNEILAAVACNMTGKYLLHRLEGTREEAENGSVPKSVQDDCIKRLISLAKDVKPIHKGQKVPFADLMPDYARLNLNKAFEVYKKFKIIPENVRLDFYHNAR
jgi:hypothetical protein